MSRLTQTGQFKVEVGDVLTCNVQPLLHEIRHALRRMLESGEHTVIDLRSIPLAPGEEERILAELGRGELEARLLALGPSEIFETRYPGVWVVTHFNNDNEVIGKFIEVCDIPLLVKAQEQDIQSGLDLLEAQLA